MYQLVYVSSAVNLFTDDELKELLAVSRRNNEKRGITGLLLYVGGNFIQILEGENNDVVETHQRISGDPRHRGLITLLQGAIEQRNFSEWSMGFHKVDRETGQALPGYSDFLGQKQDAAKHCSAALLLLDYFRKINR